MNPKVTVSDGVKKYDATIKIMVHPTTEVEGTGVLYFCGPVDLKDTFEVVRVSKGSPCCYIAQFLGKPKNHHAKVLLHLKKKI